MFITVFLMALFVPIPCLIKSYPMPYLFLSHAGFWIKEAYYREQPDVKFKHQILLVLHTDSQIGYITWSTYLNFNLLEQANLRIPLIKVRRCNIKHCFLNAALMKKYHGNHVFFVSPA